MHCLDIFRHWLILLSGYRAARVRVIFQLHPDFHDIFAGHLVYLELFRKFSDSAPRPHCLHSLSPWTRNGRRVAVVVPLSQIRMACHITPRYRTLDPAVHIDSRTDLLSICPSFYLNRYSSYWFNALTEHWKSYGQVSRVLS